MVKNSPDLAQLAQLLTDLEFGFPQHWRSSLEKRQVLVQRLQENLAARVKDLDAPLVAVLTGSTGVGKSTLLNSLVGKITQASARRPTTLTPVLVHHPDDELWIAGERILAGFEKIRLLDDTPVETESVENLPSSKARPRLLLRSSEKIPAGLCLIDCPDLDSYLSQNRQVAAHLLEVADLWVFVTTAKRYKDQPGLELLQRAAQREAMLGVVLNRVTQGTLLDAKEDLQSILHRCGLQQVPIFTIVESPLNDGEIAPEDIHSLSSWLHSLGSDALMHSGTARQVLFGSLHEILNQVEELLAEYEQLVPFAQQIKAVWQSDLNQSLDNLQHALRQGEILQGKPTQLWIELATNHLEARKAPDAWMRLRAKWRQNWLRQSLSEHKLRDSLLQSMTNAATAELQSLEDTLNSHSSQWPDALQMIGQTPSEATPSGFTQSLLEIWQELENTVAGVIAQNRHYSGLPATTVALAIMFEFLGASQAAADLSQKIIHASLDEQSLTEIQEWLAAQLTEIFADPPRCRVRSLLERLPQTADIPQRSEEIRDY